MKAITPKVIDYPFSEVKRLTGLEVSSAESRDILTRLGFGVEGNGDTRIRFRAVLAAGCRWQGRSGGRGHAHPWG